MSDYQDLVKRLREVALDDDHDLWENAELMPQAADAIEALVRGADEARGEQARRHQDAIRFEQCAVDAEDRVERAEAALKECADDLEEELRARYEMGPDKKVYMQARFERDMQPVFNARAVLTQTKGDQNE